MLQGVSDTVTPLHNDGRARMEPVPEYRVTMRDAIRTVAIELGGLGWSDWPLLGGSGTNCLGAA